MCYLVGRLEGLGSGKRKGREGWIGESGVGRNLMCDAAWKNWNTIVVWWAVVRQSCGKKKIISIMDYLYGGEGGG